MSEQKFPRRTLLKGALLGVAAVPVSALLSRSATAAGAKVDPNEPQAKSLGYVADATQGRRQGQPELQAGPDVRQLPAGTDRQAGRRRSGLQHLRRPAGRGEGLVQGLREAAVTGTAADRERRDRATGRAVFVCGRDGLRPTAACPPLKRCQRHTSKCAHGIAVGSPGQEQATMRVIKWEPFRDVDDVFDRFFAETMRRWPRNGAQAQQAREWAPLRT